MDKPSKNSTRTLSGKGAVMHTHRLAKGWSVAQLADEAGVTPKTIERLEDGENAYITTWSAVAGALNMDVNALLGLKLSSAPKLPASIKQPQPTVRIIATARVDIPKASLNDVKLKVQWINGLIQAIGASASIEIVDIYEGSTYVRISIQVDDFQRLCELFLSGELAKRAPDLRIIAIFASDLRDPDAYRNSERRSLAELSKRIGIDIEDAGDAAAVRRRTNRGRRRDEY